MEPQEVKIGPPPQSPGTGVQVQPTSDRFTNVDLFDTSKAKSAFMVASMIAASTMIPERYQNNPNNVLVAMYRATRLGMDVFSYMEVTYPVNGKTGHEAKFVVAQLNKSGTYKGPIRYEFSGDIIRDENELVSPKSTRACKAWAILKEDGSRVEQEVKIEMAFREGWATKPGADKTRKTNKWNTMPDVMLQYRAAKFLGNMYSPEIVLGMNIKEELEDIQEAEVIDEAAGKDIFEKGKDVSTAADPVLDPAKEIKQAGTAEVATQPAPAAVESPAGAPAPSSGTPAEPAVTEQVAVQEALDLPADPPADVAGFREWLTKRFSKEAGNIDTFLISKKWLQVGGHLPDLSDSLLKSLLTQYQKFITAYEAFKAARKA